jgi:hypothetical protein
MRARMRTRRFSLALLAAALLLIVSAAYAIAASPTPTPGSKAQKSAQPADDDNGVHGGPKARIHAGCTLASGLAGNWTHGDYVSAVAKKFPGDSTKVQEAAHSDCGKVDHGAARAARAKAKAARQAAKQK